MMLRCIINIIEHWTFKQKIGLILELLERQMFLHFLDLFELNGTEWSSCCNVAQFSTSKKSWLPAKYSLQTDKINFEWKKKGFCLYMQIFPPEVNDVLYKLYCLVDILLSLISGFQVEEKGFYRRQRSLIDLFSCYFIDLN